MLKIIIFLILFQSVLTAHDLTGTGASFPYKFLKSAFNKYKDHKNIEVKYTPTGSKSGFQSLKNQSVDFAAVDMFLNDDLIKSFPYPNELIHIPICLSGIGIAFNLNEISNINLSAKVISEILIRNITNWNDAKIKELNPNITLPDLEIIVILRQGGSGSTYLLTQYLSKLNAIWNLSFGSSLDINFPGCLFAKDSNQMQTLLTQITGSFGYLAYSYKKPKGFNFASIENIAGNFIKPSTKSISQAANISIPSDTRVSMINTNAQNGYPISSFSWIITYKNQNYKNKSKKNYENLKELLFWITSDGQKHTKITGYSPLPNNVKKISKKIIDSLTFNESKH